MLFQMNLLVLHRILPECTASDTARIAEGWSERGVEGGTDLGELRLVLLDSLGFLPPFPPCRR